MDGVELSSQHLWFTKGRFNVLKKIYKIYKKTALLFPCNGKKFTITAIYTTQKKLNNTQ